MIFNIKTIKITLISFLLFCLYSTKETFAQTWWAQNSNTIENLQNIAFFDNNTGYAFGDTLSTIVKTTNQGSSWTALSPVFTRGSLRSGAFLSSGSIVAVGVHDVLNGKGLVMKTVNGGASWSADTTLPEDLFDVYFANSTDGWISGENGYIARTTDGGTNLTQLTTGTGEDIFSIHFINANEGWAVGTVDIKAVILHTTNAGTNWTSQASGVPSQLFSVFFVNSSTGWAVGAGGHIIATTDSGTTWTAQTSNAVNDLFDVYFLDANNGWVVGGGGTVLKTTDGGANWALELSNTNTDISSITMKNSTLGWFCGDGGEIRFYGMSPAAINEVNDWKENINIYPNPTKGQLSINVGNYGKDWSFVLYDVIGRLVAEKNRIKESRYFIEVNVPPGMYLLKISNNVDRAYTEKIIFK